MNDQWRERLRQAVKNRAAITWTEESAIRPRGWHRARNTQPRPQQPPRKAKLCDRQIARAAHENVGYLIGERALSKHDEAMLLLALRNLRDATDSTMALLEQHIGEHALPQLDGPAEEHASGSSTDSSVNIQGRSRVRA